MRRKSERVGFIGIVLLGVASVAGVAEHTGYDRGVSGIGKVGRPGSFRTDDRSTAARSDAGSPAGDYLIVSREHGTLYAVNPVGGFISALVAGPELRDGYPSGRGACDLSSSRTDLLTSPAGDILARLGVSDRFGLYALDMSSGDCALLPGSDDPLWYEAGAIDWLDTDRLLVVADAWESWFDGRVLEYDVVAGETTVISGPERGGGPLMRAPRGLAVWDANTILVVEFGIYADEVGLYRIALDTGDRTFLSRLSVQPFGRPMPGGGFVTLGDDEGGSGPVGNSVCRDVAVICGRIIVHVTTETGVGEYSGALLEIDPDTGDRTLILGEAFVDDGTASQLIEVVPANPHGLGYISAASIILPEGTCEMVMTGPYQRGVFRYSLDTHEYDLVADLQAVIAPGLQFGASGLAVHDVCFGDCNCDGVIDGVDHATFVTCVQGPAWPEDADCRCADMDTDGDVDLADFAAYQLLSAAAGQGG